MVLLYHEPQVGALCGVHCVNTLLQGPIFNEFDLAQVAVAISNNVYIHGEELWFYNNKVNNLQIALELDAKEKELLGEEYNTAEGGNVDPSGMFSSQVLSEALRVMQLSITPISSPEMQGVAEEPQKEHAFICNLEEHWFTIRRVGLDWYNFNSIYAAPEALSTFYLAAYLASLREQGYTIFVVRGQLPAPQLPTADNVGQGRWFSPDEAKQATQAAASARQQGQVANTIENMFAKASAAGGSLQLRSRHGANQHGPESPTTSWATGGGHDADLAAAIAASLAETSSGAGTSTQLPWTAQPNQSSQANQHEEGFRGGGGGGGDVGGMHGGDDMDHELAAAIQASLAQNHNVPSNSNIPERPQQPQQPPSAETQQPSNLHGGQHQFDMDEESDLAAAIAASLQDAPGPGAATSNSQPTNQSPAEAPRPPAEPLQPEPDAGEGVIELAFRLPTGGRVFRRFTASSPTSQLHRLIEGPPAGLPFGSFKLSLQFPRKEIPPSDTSLQDAGLTDRCMLVVESK